MFRTLAAWGRTMSTRARVAGAALALAPVVPNAWVVGAAGVASLGTCTIAEAAPLVVWLNESPPSERTVARADRQTGGARHIPLADLIFPPTEQDADSNDALDALAAAVDAGKLRWEEFEVEQAIAADIADALSGVEMLGRSRARDEVVSTLLFQGAAIARAFDPRTFPKESAAARWRYPIGDDDAVPRAWLDAVALAGDRPITRADLVDGTGWVDFQRAEPLIRALPPATLRMPIGADDVWIDGQRVDPDQVGKDGLQLRPGRHWVHVTRGNQIAGVAQVDLPPGEVVDFPAQVRPSEVEAARSRVLAGTATGLPDAVADGLTALGAFYDEPVFIAAGEGSRSVVVPFSPGAQLLEERLVTFLLTGDVGGGVHLSRAFEEAQLPGGGRDELLVPAAYASLGVELGVSYFLVGMGLDTAVTPGRSIAYAAPDEQSNRFTSVYPMPWLGLGAYALRPVKRAPTLGIMAQLGYQAPAHLGVGGRVVVGVPIDNRNTWLRFTLGSTYAPNTLWDNDAADPLGLVTGFFRIGFGARL